MFLRVTTAVFVLGLLAACETAPYGATPQRSAAARTSTVVSEAEQVRVSDRVFFAFDSYALTSAARSVLNRQAQRLAANPSVRITIEGHCDERGTREYNLALGESRASAVRDYLVAQGINSNRIRTISYGKERPAVVGSNENAWRYNRRSVIVDN